MTEPVPLSRLSPEVLSAIANFVVVDAAPELAHYVTALPAYAARPESATVKASLRNVDGEAGFVLRLQLPPTAEGLPGSALEMIGKLLTAP